MRLLALGYKELNMEVLKDVEKLERNIFEDNCDINFAGILILENPLKKDTPEVIKNLNDSNIECKVISGDNPFTCVETARNCKLIDAENSEVYILDYI